MPKGEAYWDLFADYIVGLKKRKPVAFLGHNPLARLVVTVLFFLMSLQALTGLVLAGTDVYMPPFGGVIKQWVATDEASLDTVKPYSKEGVDEASYQSMRAVRKPFITLHYYTFYLLVAVLIFHIWGLLSQRFERGTVLFLPCLRVKRYLIVNLLIAMIKRSRLILTLTQQKR